MRFEGAFLLSLFAVSAVAMAAEVYGLLMQRTREIAIRRAVGATLRPSLRAARVDPVVAFRQE
jgi:ABC-type lipoprotein release transport system permease subunit